MISPQYLTEIEERVAKATNAQLIAHARTDIPALVSEVKALMEALTPFAMMADNLEKHSLDNGLFLSQLRATLFWRRRSNCRPERPSGLGDEMEKLK